MKKPEELAILADRNLRKSDEAIEEWARYRESSGTFLVRTAESAGEDVLIVTALDANHYENSMLRKAQRYRQKALKLQRKLENLVQKQVLADAKVARRMISESLGKHLLDDPLKPPVLKIDA